jgi:hypothetical protein
VGERPERRAHDDGRDRLAEGLPEVEDGDDPHEDRRELEVRRHPGPQQVERPPVSLLRRDELGAAGLDGDHLRPVVALADLAGCHRHVAPLMSPAAVVTVERSRDAGVSH